MIHKVIIMDPLTDQDFLDFLDSFNQKVYKDEYGKIHKCLDSIEELSRSDSYPYDSIIEDSIEMYGLDWMAKSSDKWRDKSRRCQRNPKRCKHFLPKTTDAISCRWGENGNLILDVIEFKFISDVSNQDKLDCLHKKIVEKQNDHNSMEEEKEEIAEDLALFRDAMGENEVESDNCEESEDEPCFDDDFVEDFESIKEDYVDNIQNSLQLKPYEAIFIVLPMLYQEYCENDANITMKDFKGYLYNMEKYFWVCVNSGTENEEHLRAHARFYGKYYRRMQPAIFKRTAAQSKKQFTKSLEDEIKLNICQKIKGITCK